MRHSRLVEATRKVEETRLHWYEHVIRRKECLVVRTTPVLWSFAGGPETTGGTAAARISGRKDLVNETEG